jgi:hypothetical protein
MNGSESSNGNHSAADPPEPVNPYTDVLTGRQPPEIAEYEMANNPYTNMLPGISSINAAKTLAEGAKSGRTGHPYLLAISLFLLLVFLLPVIIQIINFNH